MSTSKIVLMSIRIPPSINWLIKKYRSKANEIKIISKKIESFEIDKQKMILELEALKTVIELHEVPIIADDIPLPNRYTKSLNLKYGAVTASIYKCLKLNHSNKPLSISEIVLFVGADLNVTQLDYKATRRFRAAVRHRLKALAYQGKIKRVVKGSNFKESTYLLE